MHTHRTLRKALVGAVVAGALLLAGCGSDDGGGQAQTPAPTQAGS
jgi:outer membrane murein-binding lipoprotein Lpp